MMSLQSNNTYPTPTCRICLCSDEPKSLIAPCNCKGKKRSNDSVKLNDDFLIPFDY